MKITDEQLQKIIHEELQEAIRKGEITEEQLKQIQEGPIKNWFKDVGAGYDAYKAARTAREGEKFQQNADKMYPDQARQRIGYVNGDVVRDQPPGAKISTSTSTPKAAAPTAEPKPSAPTDSTSNTSAGTPQSMQTQVGRDFSKSLDMLKRHYAIAGARGDVDFSDIIGHVFGVDVNGKLQLFPPSNALAMKAIADAKKSEAEKQQKATQSTKQPERPASGDNPTTGVRGIEGSFEESKKPKSYNKLYENWRRYSKG